MTALLYGRPNWRPNQLS